MAKLKLLSFQGNNGPGNLPIQNGANPGDELLCVISPTGDGVELFCKNNPSPNCIGWKSCKRIPFRHSDY